MNDHWDYVKAVEALAEKKKIINLLIKQCMRISDESGVTFCLLPEFLSVAYVPESANPVQDQYGDWILVDDEDMFVVLDDADVRGWTQ